MSSLPTLLKPTPSTQEAPPSTSLHLLPFHISYSGPAKVSNYFPIQVIPSVQDEKHEEHALYRSYFRGRMLVGVNVKLPEGYSGHLWKSNAPSISINSDSKASTSKSQNKGNISADYPDIDYSASSPRRSPRKHASGAVNASNTSTSTATNANGNGKGKKKQPPKKRQRFAMSPDISPVKEAANTSMFEEALDKAAEILGLATTSDEAKSPQQDADESVSSEEIYVTSPAKKRAKLEAAKAEETAEAGLLEDSEMNVDIADILDEEQASSGTIMTAETTSTTIAVAGETVTTTTVKLERAGTPPPAPESFAPAIPPSTPISASKAGVPINIISPHTPSTPAGNAIFSPKIELDPQVDLEAEEEEMANQGPIHERVIQPIGVFDTITIWNPDMELDKGDDCYVKALSEWTRLADLIHS